MERLSVNTLAAAYAQILGIAPLSISAPANPYLCGMAHDAFRGKSADRLFLYNPDAIGAWVVDKYARFMREVIERCSLRLPLSTVMPSVTPVCFATIYTGAQPEVHGIKKYEKPVLSVPTLFDAAIEAGKRPVIVSTTGNSMSKIFLERNMDYFIFDTNEEVNAKAAELIVKDEYDLYAVYNGNYDKVMHKTGPESPEALAELRLNSHAFATFDSMISSLWKSHRTVVGFAMDHGCHEIDGGCGSHGLDMPEDIEIDHFYTARGE